MNANWIDFENACIREQWIVFPPILLAATFVVASLPGVKHALQRIGSPLQPFMSLQEAEALSHSNVDEHSVPVHKAPAWLTVTTVGLALVEVVVWLVVGSYSVIVGSDWIAGSFMLAAAWLYIAIRPAVRSNATPMFDVFTILIFLLVGVLLDICGFAYDYRAYGIPLPSPGDIVNKIINLLVIVALLAISFTRPLEFPSKHADLKNDMPEDYATLWQWTTFSWVTPLVRAGTDVTLNEDDVWNMSPAFRSKPLFAKFRQISPGASLLLRLWRSNGLDLTIDFCLTFVSVVMEYAGPFFLKRILDAIGSPDPRARSAAFIYAFLAFAASVVKTESDLQHLWYGRRACTRMRSQLMASVYEKALKRRDMSGVSNKESTDGKDTQQQTSADVGKIVNLMSTDANRVANTASLLTIVYSAPMEIIFATIFLFNLLGWSAFAGAFTLVIVSPLQTILSRRAVKIQKGLLAARDKRTGILNELLGAVKFIKFFAWEDRWITRTLASRQAELKWLIKERINSVLFNVLWNLAPIGISGLSFLAYVGTGNELTVGKAFTAIALFGMVRGPLNILPTFIVYILQTKVALDRIGTFLQEDEVDDRVSSLKRQEAPSEQREDELVVGFARASFKWNEAPESAKSEGEDNKKQSSDANGRDSSSQATLQNETESRFELRDLSIIFPPGELSLVTGPTASGKTALLMSLLGETTSTSPEGKILLNKMPHSVDSEGFTQSMSYAAQSPWLQHQSIKDNILFGSPYDEKRYQEVIQCCALQHDLDILEDGDATEIGSRGVSLSGGQKARVALARAVYTRTKAVLLDDPLSAVDSHTARHLYEKLLLGPLMRNRTVILVTHHVELVLPGAYYLVRLLDGRVDLQGPVKELRSRGVLDSVIHDATEARGEEDEEKAVEAEAVDKTGEEGAQEKAKPGRKLVQEEAREEGSVKWVIYKTYLKASSYYTWYGVALFITLYQLGALGEKIWVKHWGEAYDTPSNLHLLGSTPPIEPALLSVQTNRWYIAAAPANVSLTALPSAREHPLFYVGIYAAIGAVGGLFGICSSIVQYIGALRASRLLFKRLLDTVVRATMRWHDTTPTGRVLNRFSKDIETIDSSLASSISSVNGSFASFLAAILTVTVIFPAFLIPAAAITYLYWIFTIGYLNTGRDLRRMESNTRSPIFSSFGEMLEGIVTVRAFSAELRFFEDLHSKLDTTTKFWYGFWMTNRWLLFRFDILGASIILVTTLLALSGVTNAGIAGITITAAMSSTMGIYWTCRLWTQLELDLNSVERVVEYLELPQEPPSFIDDNRPPAYWPSSGQADKPLVVVEDLEVKYAPELPSVLHSISFNLKPRERVGLLGRTGSGKSTLAMSLLRFVDPASGKIIIDGIDITKIGIQDLRSRITFIPQDATLFSGTLRENLDPFGEHTDFDCLDVLHRVQLLTESNYNSQRSSREASRAPSIAEGAESTQSSLAPSPTSTQVEDVKTGPITLDTKVSAAGANFSQGQRQLIAMARALLRQSSIIVLDEATSSIDFETDAKIQSAIREEFKGSLLITVAHRLRTIIDYDRLIVLDKGRIAELDTPWNLIQKEGGIFREMCLQSGTFTELSDAAKNQSALLVPVESSQEQVSS